ncbi:MAG: trypsin-like peptidase domain-containing protein, partial [Patescibacteria group bacterium]
MALRYRWTAWEVVVVALILSLPVILGAQTTEPCLEEKARQHIDQQHYERCLKMHTMQQIFESPYVIGVHAIKDGHFGFGTGVVRKIGERWYIITNNHVIEGANEIFVQFFRGDEKMHSVSLAGRDPAADIALLEAPILPRGVSSVLFGGKPRIAEEVYALGYPYGMRSITLGFVNALSTRSQFYFLTQTPVNPGNSGGPLFNVKHEMIGLNTVIIPGAMMSFSLFIEYA